MEKKLKIVMLSVVAAILLFPTVKTYGDQAEEKWTGGHEGNIAFKATFLDLDGNPVVGGVTLAAYSRVEASIFTPNGTRIRWIQLTAAWTTTDISSGYDTTTFRFVSTVTLTVDGDNGNETWSYQYDLDPTGSPDIDSNLLNGSTVWTIDLRNELDLNQDARDHGSVPGTAYDLNFIMTWEASMYDSVDEFLDMQTGDPLALVAECNWDRGFWTQGTLG